MNYEDMIELDINANVTELEYGCGDWEFNGVEFYHCGIDGSGYFSQPVIDYCNDWAYGGLIIQNAKISLIKTDDDRWTAFEWENDGNESWHKNPLRAAMIVYLMMNEK